MAYRVTIETLGNPEDRIEATANTPCEAIALACDQVGFSPLMFPLDATDNGILILDSRSAFHAASIARVN